MELLLRQLLLLLAVMPAVSLPNTPTPAPLEVPAQVGYPTVAAALAALHSKKDVAFKVDGGWTIASDPSTYTLWSFAPSDNPAYPSVVKRAIIQSNDTISIDMNVLCEAPKRACDKLVADFLALNERMRQSFHKGR